MVILTFTNSEAGLTLIETLIYIAFFAFLIGSLLGITFQTIAATDQVNKKIVLLQESNFILGKLDWALIGAQTITVPVLNSSGSELKLNQYAGPNNPIDFTLSGGYINLSLAGSAVGPAAQLNSQNVIVSNFVVITSQVVGQPEEVQTSFTLTYYNDPTNSQTFQLAKYLKQ